jgi:hypothetical protein
MGGDRNGTYSGTADVLTTGGGVCITNRTVSGFHVHGDSVRWGRFRGRITSRDSLQMVNGNTWVIGRFFGTRFEGQISVMGPLGSPGCSYILTLERTGS